MAATNAPLRRAPHRQGVPTAMARYESMDEARKAVQALEHHGVDGVDIALGGWRARAAERSRRKSGADERLVRHLALSLFRGSLLGGVTGAAIAAALTGIAIWAWPGHFDSWLPALLAATAFGAGLGALVGSLVDVEEHAGFSDAWTLTLQDVPDGSVWVLLFDDSVKARDALAATEPTEVRSPPR